MSQILDFDSQIGGLEGMDFGCEEEPEKENANHSKRKKVPSKAKTVVDDIVSSDELFNDPEENYELSTNSPKIVSVGRKHRIVFSSSEDLDENHAETSLNRPQPSKATDSATIVSESDDADEDPINAPTAIESGASVRTACKTTPITRKSQKQLLEQQVESQKRYQKFTNDYQQSMQEMQQKKLEELMKIRRSCQQQEYELKKHRHLKEKQIKILEEDLADKKKFRLEFLKQTVAKIEIKQKMLDLKMVTLSS